MYHTSLMLHPESGVKTMADFSKDLGLDDCSVHVPTIDPLPSKLFTTLMWGKVARTGIDIAHHTNFLGLRIRAMDKN